MLIDNLKKKKTFFEKLKLINPIFIGLIVLLSCIGFTSLYSAAGGNINPWASKQILRFFLGFAGMMIIAFMDLKTILKLSYLAYFGSLVLLVLVEIVGDVGMGAQRWIDLGFMKLQPSEVMKIALIMALARYFNATEENSMKSIKFLIPPSLMILLPVLLVLKQPDLGTALILVGLGASVFILCGLSYKLLGIAVLLVSGSLPFVWNYGLKDYQRGRVLTFLNPERDPLGEGYHIIQSKIAFGSGGLWGRGFLKGSQSYLNFLPEKQTDFIFTLFAEEWGFAGVCLVMLLYTLILIYGFIVALNCQNIFGKILATGININLFLYIFINIGMITGMLPVVGVPLPLFSYGGTVMLITMAGFGFILNTAINHDQRLNWKPKLGDF
ncbi:MAG: rod shape-determining protein RodA [Alphaproteobacteria bacterium]|nr:rod shape-determining protein RodA [Alphaproteobacteria bacterium]